jgi:hypothetical protein
MPGMSCQACHARYDLGLEVSAALDPSRMPLASARCSLSISMTDARPKPFETKYAPASACQTVAGPASVPSRAGDFPVNVVASSPCPG